MKQRTQEFMDGVIGAALIVGTVISMFSLVGVVCITVYWAWVRYASLLFGD